LYTGEHWNVTPNIDWLTLAQGILIVLPTVATQELLFRGYAYKKTVEVGNVILANIVWGLLFASYHDIWGNPIILPFTVLSFLIAHYVFASALLKSLTLYLTIGIHLGHNWSSQFFNGYKPTDISIFYLTDQKNFTSWSAFLIFWFTYNLGFILLALILWMWRAKATKLELPALEDTGINAQSSASNTTVL
jgi:membrane protease YdiL (CAAX protease family)